MTWIDLVKASWASGALIVLSMVLLGLIRGAIAIAGIFSAKVVWHSPGFPVPLSLSIVGFVSGFLTGSSRESAVGAVVPAVLTFVGLFVIYLTGRAKATATMAGIIVLVFSVNLMFGTILGSMSRNEYEAQIASVYYQKAAAEREFAIRAYRTQLGLPPDPRPDLSLEIKPPP